MVRCGPRRVIDKEGVPAKRLLVRRARLFVAVPDRAAQPRAIRRPVDLERLRGRIEQPDVAHARARVDAHLADPVVALRGRREHLTCPVWRELEGSNVRQLRHAFAAPPREIQRTELECREGRRARA